MEFFGTLLQLVGAVVTAIGLFIAWDRAANVFSQWRQSLVGLSARLFPPPVIIYDVSSHVVVKPEIGVEGKALDHEQTPEERLADAEVRLKSVETDLKKLPTDTRNEIKAAIDKSLADFDARLKSVALKDIYPALIGIGVTFIGTFLVLISQITCY